MSVNHERVAPDMGGKEGVDYIESVGKERVMVNSAGGSDPADDDGDFKFTLGKMLACLV